MIEIYLKNYVLTFVDDLEASIDIIDLVGRYTKLKKAGTNYKALCPFPGHSEKTPSFVASPAKQIGYCFGCHKGGGPVKFIMDMDNCEFREALQILGNITGTEIPGYTENREQIEIKKNLYSLYKDATQYYKSALEKNPEVKKYLMDRGLSSEDIGKFHFGYADSGISLYNYLKEKGYEDELIGTSQIFLDVRSRKDKFIGRVIFPIQNLRGDFVAFAGRIIGKGEPKYLNSPASDIYDKSSILYGLFDARNAVTKHDQIIITEGYMDTIALHRAGFLQTVAVSGTALTEKHITIIKRLTRKIYLCFDNDKAGEQATRNSLEILKNKELEVKIIALSGGKDPDEFLESGGDFTSLIDNALSPIAFLIEKNKYDLKSIDEKKKFIAEVLTVIKSYGDAVERDSYLKELSLKSNTPIKIIYEMFKNLKAGRAKKVSDNENNGGEKYQVTPSDIMLSYLYDNHDLQKVFQDKFILPEGLESNLQKALSDPKNYFSSLDITKKNLLKALSLRVSQQNTPLDQSDKELDKMIHEINKQAFKKLSETYKTQMDEGDSEALKKYSQLLQIAKKHRMK